MIYKNILKRTGFFAWVFIIVISSISCSHQSTETNDKNTVRQLLMLEGDESAESTALQLISNSNIREKGFVLIIPTSLRKDDPEAEKLRNQFYKTGVRAVHILNINLKHGFKKTDIISIEKAEIICFTGESAKQFFSWSGRSRLSKHIANAKKNGALIAGRKEVLSHLKLQ
jgi:cyanophycinase-like exopeptidase